MTTATRLAPVLAVLFAATAAQAEMVISSKPTSNVACAAGVCSATAAKAVLNATDLTNMLAGGDVTLVPGTTAEDIRVAAAVSWASAQRLTLDSYHAIAIWAPVVATGGGALTLTINDGGRAGDLRFSGAGYAGFWDLESSLIVNGTSYTLVGDVKSLAAAIEADPTGSYALAADYDATADGTYTASPVRVGFRGNFEGLGHTIRNLSILDRRKQPNTADALFKRTGHQAVIRDLILEAVSASGGGEGFLAGLVAVNYGAILNVRVAGQITGRPRTDIIGGVAAQNFGRIRDASFAGDVSGSGAMGGLVGWNYNTIDHSRTSGTVNHIYLRPGGDTFVGGLAGFNGYIQNGFSGGIIIASHSTSAVASNVPETSVGGLVGGTRGFIWKSSASGSVTFSSDAGAVGGLAGLNIALIQECHAEGPVSATGDVNAAGGFVGDNGNGTVQDSYALGAVQGGDNSGYAGGFVGANGRGTSGSVVTSYSTGQVTAGTKNLGGFVGFEQGGQAQTYWDLDTSGISDPSKGAGNIANDPGLTGLTDSQLKSALPAGFAAKVWRQSPSINNGYPFLRANPPQ